MGCEGGVSRDGDGTATVYPDHLRSIHAPTCGSPPTGCRPGSPPSAIRAGLSAGPRRSPGAVDHRGVALPRWRAVGGWWIPRRRGVLRAVWLLDHLAPDRRVAYVFPHPAAGLLGPAGATAPSGSVRARVRRRCLLHDWLGPCTRFQGSKATGWPRSSTSPTGTRSPPAADISPPRPDVAAPTHLVAGDRGAVLPALAAPAGQSSGSTGRRDPGSATVARHLARGDDRRRGRIRESIP